MTTESQAPVRPWWKPRVRLWMLFVVVAALSVVFVLIGRAYREQESLARLRDSIGGEVSLWESEMMVRPWGRKMEGPALVIDATYVPDDELLEMSNRLRAYASLRPGINVALRLNLRKNSTTSLRAFRDMSCIKLIWIERESLTAEDIASMATMKNLQCLAIWRSGFSNKQLEALREQLPKADILAQDPRQKIPL